MFISIADFSFEPSPSKTSSAHRRCLVHNCQMAELTTRPRNLFVAENSTEAIGQEKNSSTYCVCAVCRASLRALAQSDSCDGHCRLTWLCGPPPFAGGDWERRSGGCRAHQLVCGRGPNPGVRLAVLRAITACHTQQTSPTVLQCTVLGKWPSLNLGTHAFANVITCPGSLCPTLWQLKTTKTAIPRPLDQQQSPEKRKRGALQGGTVAKRRSSEEVCPGSALSTENSAEFLSAWS